MARRTRTAVATGAMALLVAGATVVAGGGAAYAAPGDPVGPGSAQTVGAASQFAVDLDGVTIPLQQTSFGALAVTLPGQDESATTDAVILGVPGVADITSSLVATRATSTRDGVLAQADVEGTDFSLFGLSILGLDRAAAEAQCLAGEEPEAAMLTQGLTILGVPVTIDETTPGYEASVPLGAGVAVSDTPGDVVDMTGIDLTVKAAQEKIVDASGAIAISLAVQVVLSGSLGGTPITAAVISQFVLAEAGCIALSPLSLASLSALSGPTAGGQAVTITGTGFTSGTTVDFGGAAATDVVVDATGTSLTAVTPAHAAGDVTVTVTTSSGATATLPYSYVAPIVPPSPGDRPQLAESGADPTLPLGIAVLTLLAGTGSLLVSRRRRA